MPINAYNKLARRCPVAHLEPDVEAPAATAARPKMAQKCPKIEHFCISMMFLSLLSRLSRVTQIVNSAAHRKYIAYICINMFYMIRLRICPVLASEFTPLPHPDSIAAGPSLAVHPLRRRARATQPRPRTDLGLELKGPGPRSCSCRNVAMGAPTASRASDASHG